MSSSNRYDAIIVGAGHNGLVTAFYLARAGRKVLVLEARDIVGGAATTEEVWPGFRVSTAAYIGGFVDERIVEEMGMVERGYEVVPQDPTFFCPFPDGRSLTLHRDLEKSREAIAEFSERDADAYPRYLEMLERLASFLKPILPMRPPRVPPQGLRDWLKALGLLRRFKGMTERDVADLAKVLMCSCKDLLDEYFESEELKGLLASQSVLSTHGGPYSPGTGYVLLHHALGEGDWGFVKGGLGSVSRIMAEAAEEQGAEIRTGVRVESILTRDGRTVGVRATPVEGEDFEFGPSGEGVANDRGDGSGSTGEPIEAGIVASCADPRRTFLGLLDPDELPADFVEAIRGFNTTSMVTKVNLAVSELPDFTARPGTDPAPHHQASIEISPSMEYLERAFDDAKYGGYSKRPYIETVIPTTAEPELAPDGHHILSLYCQYAAYELAEGSWETERERYADRILGTLAEFAPNVPGSVVHRQVLTPPDLEREFGLAGGNVFHGAMTPDQFFFLRPAPGWARYATPIDGLYLCGSGAHPGGGVRGLPGYNAAHTILEET